MKMVQKQEDQCVYAHGNLLEMYTGRNNGACLSIPYALQNKNVYMQ